MELTINIEDLSNVVILDSNGNAYSLVSEDKYKSLTEQVDELTNKLAKSQSEFLSQAQLLKRFKIGRQKLKEWVADGLHEIPMGGTIYFDVKEVNEYLRSKKIQEM